MQNAEYTYYADGAFFHARADGTMGTRFDMIVAGLEDKASRALWTEVGTLLTEGDRVFNRFSPGSEVSGVNLSLAGEHKAVLGTVLEEEIARCLDYRLRTGGLFDITRNSGAEIRLENGVLYAEDPTVNLDFGGYAKGWALKGIRKMLDRYGVRSAFVDFGGSSILAKGEHPAGNSWEVDLPSPYDGHVVARYSLHDEALSTSGNTPWYSGHILNPLSGEREVSRAVATARCADPLDAEVLSTVYMICDTCQRKMIEESFPDVEFAKYDL